MAVALVALFVSLSGVALAVNTITSADIVDGEVKNQDLGSDSVGSGKIADRQVKNADLSIGASSSNTIADGGIQGVDVKADTLTGAQIDESTLSGVPSQPTGPADGDLAGSYPNPTIATGAVGPDELAAVPSARVFSAANGACTEGQTIAHNTETALQFAREAFDEGGLHAGSPGTWNCDAATNPKLTAPRAGLYQVSAGVLWSANATGKRTLLIRASDGTGLAQEEYDAASTGATLQSASTVTRLVQGQAVEARVIQTSGVDLAVNSLFDQRSHLAMAWLGP